MPLGIKKASTWGGWGGGWYHSRMRIIVKHTKRMAWALYSQNSVMISVNAHAARSLDNS